MEIKIKISEDYTKTPGGRTNQNGPYSGTEFRDTMLIPKLKEVINKGGKLVVDFDGLYGCGVSFLEESFGGLIRKGFLYSDIKKHIKYIANEDDTIVPKIEKYLKEANKNEKK